MGLAIGKCLGGLTADSNILVLEKPWKKTWANWKGIHPKIAARRYGGGILMGNLWIFVLEVDCFFFPAAGGLYVWNSCEILRGNRSYHIQMLVKTPRYLGKSEYQQLAKPWNMEDSHVVYNSIGVIHLSLSIPFRSWGLSHRSCRKESFNDGASTSVGRQITLRQANIAMENGPSEDVFPTENIWKW